MAGIYLHIPFCKQACHYCDFHFSTSLKRKDDLLRAMHTELALRKDELKDKVISTIYLGGGTPSLLTADEISRLFETIKQHYSVDDTIEFTLEANPDDLNPLELKAFKKVGVNRLSIGVQSFYAPELLMMNRAHTEAEAYQSVSDACSVFDNVSIDLIYGIPGLSDERWQENLQLAFDLGIQHLSSYALTVEPKTALAAFIKAGKYPPVSEQLSASHFDLLSALSVANGFEPYEISNFAKNGRYSKHNTAYWQGKSYLGIGPAAHSFNGVQRSWNIANNARYIKALAKVELPSTYEVLSAFDQANETIMTGLRTKWGIDLDFIEAKVGKPLKDKLLNIAQQALQDGLLYRDGNHLKTSQKGKFLSDGLAAKLFFVD